MAVIRPQFDYKEYQKVILSDKKYNEGLKQYFKDCSKNYSDYLNHYFYSKGGVIVGFRY